MAKKRRTAEPAFSQTLDTEHTRCWACERPLWISYHKRRTIATLDGLCRLTLKVRTCENPDCLLYHRAYRPEQEGRWALPHGEFGLDIIALVGALRYCRHSSVPEIRQELLSRGVSVAERTVTNLLYRYEELVALHLGEQARLQECLAKQGRVILAIDGLQPDVGHEVLWVLRDCLCGEVLVAKSLLSSTAADLASLIAEVKAKLSVPIAAVISDGQMSLRQAVVAALPGVPHQLCQFHYLREAATPIYEADRHGKKELKKLVRGVRPIERKLEKRQDVEAQAVMGYCQAVRSAISDDGRPPLCASGLKLQQRLQAVHSSVERVAKRGLCR